MGFFPRCLAVLALAIPLVAGQAQPALPLSSSSRWILDANGVRVKFKCANWPGHLEANVPEGLSSQPLDTIVNWVADNGASIASASRIVSIWLSPPPLSFRTRSPKAVSPLALMRPNLPQSTPPSPPKTPPLANSARIDVFGAVIDALWARGVMTVLDNHVSKASWCCDYTDGNGWWDTASGIYDAANQQYFVTSNWLAGLEAMAIWAKGHPGVVAMSLRNEMRQIPILDSNSDWYKYVEEAGSLIHANNEDLLIVVGGTLGAMDLSMLKTENLDTSGWKGKNVWEFHAYSFSVLYSLLGTDCSVVQGEYGLYAGFTLVQNEAYTGPLWLSEFGVAMTGGTESGLSTSDFSYLQCLVQYMTNNDADWSIWGLQGSYYVREGTINYDESFGLLTTDWSTWRNPDFAPLLGAMWNTTQGP
ncbi:Glycoside hydrolase family 5 protein [Mycena sanguinolenta]|uniref:Glycoside hydrolase family 5 protein n=1 Tax=Mycena sanguinolenta TaxID=230812 RepID=A0A8H7DGI1_9AGAR|nr:Glycoside hydrolase family 5 protein [Mycena sanguinolenta]